MIMCSVYNNNPLGGNETLCTVISIVYTTMSIMLGLQYCHLDFCRFLPVQKKQTHIPGVQSEKRRRDGILETCPPPQIPLCRKKHDPQNTYVTSRSAVRPSTAEILRSAGYSNEGNKVAYLSLSYHPPFLLFPVRFKIQWPVDTFRMWRPSGILRDVNYAYLLTY